MSQAHKFRKGKSLFSTTLSSGISTGTSDTITPNSVSGLPTDTEITLTIDRVNSSNTATPDKMERITGVVSGGNLVSYTRGVDGTTEQSHSSGAVVEYIWNADDLNDMVDGILIGHDQNGAHRSSEVVLASYLDTDTSLTANSDTKVATQKATKTYVDSHASNTDGWVSSADTWTYVSSTSFKISGQNRTTTFTKGTRIKCTNSTVKYFVVISSAFSTDTTVTITGGTDYSLTNTTISSPYYSYEANPQGYPGYFNYTPTVTAGSGSFTSVSATGRASIFGNTCIDTQLITNTTNGTAATDIRSTLLVTADSANYAGAGILLNDYTVLSVGLLSATSYDIRTATSTYPGGSGKTYQITITYNF